MHAKQTCLTHIGKIKLLVMRLTHLKIRQSNCGSALNETPGNIYYFFCLLKMLTLN